MGEMSVALRARSRPASRVLAGALCVVALTAAACGSDNNMDTSAGSTPLEGTTWVLTTKVDLGVDLRAAAVTARFEGGTVSGQSGCNTYTGPYELDGSSLTIGPNIASTQTACAAPLMAVEKVYLERLPKVASYQIDGNSLTLADSDGKALLSYTASSPAEAILGKWTVTSYYNGAEAITSVVGGATLTAEFTAGRISGSTGCNRFTGDYTLNGDAIAIGQLALTRAACTSDELSKQESDYIAALGLTKTVQITGNRLDLLRDGGTIAVTYEKG